MHLNKGPVYFTVTVTLEVVCVALPQVLKVMVRYSVVAMLRSWEMHYVLTAMEVCVCSGSCTCSVPVIFNCHSCFLLCFDVFFFLVCVCMCVAGSVLPSDNRITMSQHFMLLIYPIIIIYVEYFF